MTTGLASAMTCLRLNFICAFLLCAVSPVLAQTAATLTFIDGKVTLLRGTSTFTAAAGSKISAGDMLETAAKGQAQLEFADGLVLNLGPEARLYLLPQTAGAVADYALATGWMKAAIPAGRKGDGSALRYILPGLTVETTDATLVLHASAGLDEVFVESGSAKLTELSRDGLSDKSLAAKGSDYVSRKADQTAALGRPPQAFLGGMPRHFMDNLPALIAKLKGAAPDPARDHDTTYAEARAWLNGNALVRAALVARYQPRTKDAEFKSGLTTDMAMHPEWERALVGGKAPAKKK